MRCLNQYRYLYLLWYRRTVCTLYHIVIILFITGSEEEDYEQLLYECASQRTILREFCKSFVIFGVPKKVAMMMYPKHRLRNHQHQGSTSSSNNYGATKLYHWHPLLISIPPIRYWLQSVGGIQFLLLQLCFFYWIGFSDG